ncbi:5-formyltetrahydrofolate cyclo-ligase family protein [Arthrobacter ulcerisalmonis]|uniref:5-formyltetrahydrofolate cyclo-ligase n=1 Tax=Arthrobacter ulcerisalmonis TaxID=2483813 RepID=A0A3P5X7X9_9MICC|nr:5-formyltetrahydrofolate cyclo-ligase [Arthrobacter ulcerisalmonis]VDC26901.1 5-formyltetrahydrofolate cyclo-ligase family protein [Arthrobacter ulcerisalmonis]
MTDARAAAKEEIRAAHRRQRATRSAADLDVAGNGLAHHGLAWLRAQHLDAGTTVCAYWSVGMEPPTQPLLTALHDAGYQVLLPVCEPHRELSWVHWTPGVAFTRSRYAPIDEPVGPAQPTAVAAAADVLFLPATAVDASGNRIGQGGGYYDVFLTHLTTAGSQVAQAAIVFDAELLPPRSIPAEPLDRPVPNVLTPSGLHRLDQTE